MLIPLKEISFKLVIEAISGHQIIPFNSNDKKDKVLLEKLCEVATLAGKNIDKKGIKQL